MGAGPGSVPRRPRGTAGPAWPARRLPAPSDGHRRSAATPGAARPLPAPSASGRERPGGRPRARSAGPRPGRRSSRPAARAGRRGSRALPHGIPGSPVRVLIVSHTGHTGRTPGYAPYARYVVAMTVAETPDDRAPRPEAVPLGGDPSRLPRPPERGVVHVEPRLTAGALHLLDGPRGCFDQLMQEAAQVASRFPLVGVLGLADQSIRAEGGFSEPPNTAGTVGGALEREGQRG